MYTCIHIYMKKKLLPKGLQVTNIVELFPLCRTSTVNNDKV